MWRSPYEKEIEEKEKNNYGAPPPKFKVGQEVEAKIVDFNEADKKISLSIKAMFAPEKEEEAPAEEEGDVVSVDIDKVIAEQSEENE